MPADKETNPQAENIEAITSGISDVVSAALGVGAALARTVAEATAAGQPAPPGTRGEGPFADIIHYTVQAASNVGRQVIRGMPSAAASTPPTRAAASEPVFPSVHAGSTLRIPLSIENPSSEEMSRMAFACGVLTYEGNAGGTPLTIEALVFQPAVLTIAPRDFEKLTVFIETAEQTALGVYVAKVVVEGGTFESALRFEVRPPTR